MASKEDVAQPGPSRRNRKFKLRNAKFRPQSTSQPELAPPQPGQYDYLYSEEGEANLLNFVHFLNEERVKVEREVPPTDPQPIGRGTTMEVYSASWKGQKVAVKRMIRDRRPVRSRNLPIEQDTIYLEERRDFYVDVKTIMQEILVMSRVSYSWCLDHFEGAY